MTNAEVAQVNYVARQVEIDAFARELVETAPLTARIYRNYARIAWFAAKAEMDDPDPMEVVRSCGICHGVRVCDITLHLNRARLGL